jgi:RNA polymerase sigma-70 factor (ECF subfamily)
MPKPLSFNEERLKKLARLAKKDKQAWGELYEVFFDRVYAYFFYRVANQEVAEDLTQQLFLKVFSSLATYRLTRRPFGAWVFKIAHNLLVDYYRQKKDEVILEAGLPFEDKWAQAKLEQLEERAVLEEALKKIKGDYREVVYLRFLIGLSVKETAYAMGRSESAVKLLQLRALQALRKEMEGERREG